ncbi:MAG: PEP-CTERM sorting domain-containing protein [Planctomycetota bacterium]
MNDTKTGDRAARRGLDSMAWYGLAAGAATLGLGNDASAAIIEVGFSASHDDTTPDSGAGNFGSANDLAGNISGLDNISLGSTVYGTDISLNLFMNGGSGVLRASPNTAYAALLSPGDVVGPGSTFGSGTTRVVTDFNIQGNLAPRSVVDGIIGMQIQLDDGLGNVSTHYGYLTGLNYDIDVSSVIAISGSFFYEDTPDTAITVVAIPEPSGLALLAAGAAGVMTMRRHRKAA